MTAPVPAEAERSNEPISLIDEQANGEPERVAVIWILEGHVRKGSQANTRRLGKGRESCRGFDHREELPRRDRFFELAGPDGGSDGLEFLRLVVEDQLLDFDFAGSMG
jgi:hypothetical protein